MKKSLILLAALTALMVWPQSANAQWVQTSGPGNYFVSNLASQGRYLLAACYGKNVFRSDDSGATWVKIDSGLSDTTVLALVVKGPYLFAGTMGGRVFRSVDSGTSWTLTAQGFASFSCFAVKDTFLFAGAGVGIIRSANNGSSWTNVMNGLTGSYQVTSLAVSRNYLFVGRNGGGVFRSVNNGNNWAAANSGLTNLNVLSIAVNGPVLFAGTYGGGVFRSLDNGNSWTSVNTGLSNLTIWSIISLGEILFAGTQGGGIFLSADSGATWSAVNTGLPSGFSVASIAIHGDNIIIGSWGYYYTWRRPLSDMGISLAGGLFVAVGDSGQILTSPDGINWTPQNSGTAAFLKSVTWTGRKYVAVGGVICTSDDGVTWNSQPGGSLSSVTWTGSQLVAVGTGSAVITSPDGQTWTNRNLGTSQSLESVTWTGSQLAAVGGYVTNPSRPGDGATGIVFTSPDGISWTNTYSAGIGWLYSVAWADTQLVAVGYNRIGIMGTYYPTIITSPDANTWTFRSSGGVGYLCIVWTGSQIVAGGYSSIVASSDGINWTIKSPGISGYPLYGFGWGKDLIIAVGRNGSGLGSIWTSPDAVTWTARYTSASTMSLRSVIWANMTAYINNTGIMTDAPEIVSPHTSDLKVNVCNSHLFFSLPSSMLGKAVDLAVYSASGRVVLQKRISRGSERLSLPVSNLALGAYVLHVKDGTQKQAVRFVVVR